MATSGLLLGMAAAGLKGEAVQSCMRQQQAAGSSIGA
jgi:hypothetical protein